MIQLADDLAKLEQQITRAPPQVSSQAHARNLDFTAIDDLKDFIKRSKLWLAVAVTVAVIFGFITMRQKEDVEIERITPLERSLQEHPGVFNRVIDSKSSVSQQTAQELELGDPGVLQSNRESSGANERAREGKTAEAVVVDGRARIVSPNGSNKLMVRVESCDSTSRHVVDAGLTVRIIRQFPRDSRYLVSGEDGTIFCLPEENLEPLVPAEE